MTSVDTNILLHALDGRSPHNARARAFLDAHQSSPDFVLSELALTELYVLLRNPALFAAPLSADQAVATVEALASNARWRRVDHDPRVMPDVWNLARTDGFARTRIYDARLGLGLIRAGVTDFATRNLKHFRGIGFRNVFDPT